MKAISRLKGTSEPAEKKKSEPKIKFAIEEGLGLAIDQYLDSKIEGRWKERKGFAPSETNQCARYYTYLFRGIYVPADHNAKTQRVFDNGHAMHERLNGYLEDMGILIDKEIPAPHDHLPVPLSGFADGLIEWNGKKIVEYKSINEAGFMHRKLYNKPKDDHYRQIQLYLASFDLDIGYVIYENKNTQELLIIEVERNQDFIDKLLKKYGKIYQGYLDNVLPDRPYKKDSQNCKWCKLHDHCWSDNEGVVDKQNGN